MDLEKSDFLEFLSESGSTGADDRISTFSSPFDDEVNPNWLNSQEHLEAPNEFQRAAVLCSVCHRNFIELEQKEEGRRKRRKIDEGPILTSKTVCEDCLGLQPSDLGQLKYASAKSKRAIKREHAKRRTAEQEALRKLQEQQEELLKNAGNLPEHERKRLQQMIRNRISAQQSRDRKKAYVSQLERENETLQCEVSSLKRRVMLLEMENKTYKSRLAQVEFSDNSGYSRAVGASLVFGVMAVMFVVAALVPNSTVQLQPRRLTQATEIVESTANLYSFEQGNTPLALPDDKLLSLRSNRLEVPYNLRPATADPCTSLAELSRKDSAVSTMFCPNVQLFISEESTDLKYLQLLMPASEFPLVPLSSTHRSQNDLVELMCRIVDIDIVSAS
mmetsp:Transcript_2036/g.4659  ORF Transcript_2036/g.4659 Transcript_2036/m.4659 type:complete len:389 (+) Transcript_2036:285-1451(+)|eukprot:CAMPEP_0204904226 /NCGR_PEP_ID=MMETSP1397-20131031/4741_1 /ASSEMBLY_ACC=CAM_ASM_000891 /TAXON_ID=49980 /ORGANISM="Climacostomum Climacostomum virens, Strain Stock W-24" /LENGTH=388 /DNA_ID=CAMNT_0052072989 /DNA_START=187 /DNA_END=1353 /DNA_ORIENTATION=+